MKKAVALLIPVLLFVVATAQAQLSPTTYGMAPRWDVNINSGVMLAENTLFTGFVSEDFDAGVFEEEAEAVYHLSGDLSYRFSSGLMIGAQAGWSPMTESRFLLGRTVTGGAIEADNMNLYLYSANVGYVYPFGRFGVYGRAGVGGATFSIEPGNTTVTDDSQTRWQTPVTVGVRVALSPALAFDVAARDNIIYSSGEADDTSHNFYFGAGVALRF